MGNAAAVLSNKNNSNVNSKKGGSCSATDKNKSIPKLSEWDKYLREYALKMQKNRKCMHCFMEFKNVSSFVAHLANSHHPTVSFSTSSIDSKSGEPICVDCRKGFSSIKMLQQHLQQPCKQYWASEEQGNAEQTKSKKKVSSRYKPRARATTTNHDSFKIKPEKKKKCDGSQPSINVPAKIELQDTNQALFSPKATISNSKMVANVSSKKRKCSLPANAKIVTHNIKDNTPTERSNNKSSSLEMNQTNSKIGNSRCRSDQHQKFIRNKADLINCGLPWKVYVTNDELVKTTKTKECTRNKNESSQKIAGLKRTISKANTNNEKSKKHKCTTQLAESNMTDTASITIPSSLPCSNKKSVKTINSGSCIRQYSRPILASASLNNPQSSAANTGQQIQSGKGKVKTINNTTKSKSKSQYKSSGRVFSSRSLGLIDFDKIKTTARTRNMVSCSKSIPDLRITPKKEIIISKIERRIPDVIPDIGQSKSDIFPIQKSVLPTPSIAEDKVVVCNGNPSHYGEGSSSEQNSSDQKNGVNKEVKSYLILKVMPIVQPPVNNTASKPILPKQTYQKIQPKPQVVLQNNTPKSLLVLKVPDSKGNNLQASKTSNDKCSVLFGNNPGIRATKTYGQTHGKKRKSANDLKDNEQIDSVK